jgi:predicted homoserine dehydrogenase-like protein
LAHKVKLVKPVAKDMPVSFSDVELVDNLDVVEFRKEYTRTMACKAD